MEGSVRRSLPVQFRVCHCPARKRLPSPLTYSLDGAYRILFGVDVELCVDVPQMGSNRAFAQHQLILDLGSVHALGEAGEDFLLATGQAVKSGSLACLPKRDLSIAYNASKLFSVRFSVLGNDVP